jgi:hypothetical protein
MQPRPEANRPSVLGRPLRERFSPARKPPSLSENRPMKEKREKTFTQTVRQQIASLLMEKERTAREISQETGIRQKEVYDHLSHIARSAAAQGKKLKVLPFMCLSCGFVFEERRRFTPASRCPRCKKTHLEFPTYHLS